MNLSTVWKDLRQSVRGNGILPWIRGIEFSESSIFIAILAMGLMGTLVLIFTN